MPGMIQRALLGLAKRAIKMSGLPLRDPSVTTLFGYMDTYSGTAVTEWTAMTYSAVWAATRLYGDLLGSLPCTLNKRIEGGGYVEDRGHKVWPLLATAPNKEMTPFVQRETMMAHVLNWGNAYGEIERDGAGRPLAVWPIVPNRVVPDRAENGDIFYWIRRSTGGTYKIPAADMIHVPGLGFDGLVGYSVITMAREAIGLGLAEERFGATYFGNGSVPGAIITTDQVLKKETRDNIKESWQLLHQGPDRSHRLAVLDGGATYNMLSVQPEDAQFLQSRQFQIEEVARWYNLPPHMLRQLIRANYNTIEQQSIELVVYSLRPWVIRWEQEYERKLLTPAERVMYCVSFDLDGLMRGDMAARFKAWGSAKQYGWMSADDIRDKERLNPLPGGQGKLYAFPTNTVPASMVVDGSYVPKMPGQGKDAAPRQTKNPTDPMDYSFRSVDKATRRPDDAEVLLDAMARDGDGQVRVKDLISVDENPPFDVKTVDWSKKRKIKKVNLGELTATQCKANPEEIRKYIQDPWCLTDVDKEGLFKDVSLIYVAKCGGELYLVDGTHRAMARILRGMASTMAYVKKV